MCADGAAADGAATPTTKLGDFIETEWRRDGLKLVRASASDHLDHHAVPVGHCEHRQYGGCLRRGQDMRARYALEGAMHKAHHAAFGDATRGRRCNTRPAMQHAAGDRQLSAPCASRQSDRPDLCRLGLSASGALAGTRGLAGLAGAQA